MTTATTARMIGRAHGATRLIAAGFTLCAVEVGIRVLPLARLARLLGVDIATSGTPPSAVQPLSFANFLWVRAAQRVVALLGPRGRCLRESLVVGALLRRHQPVLWIGVARDADRSLNAHAWIEVDGVVYDPRAPQYAALAPVAG